MTTLSDRIDHFVRWFVNSSPEVTHIAPRRKPVEGLGDEAPKGPESRRSSPRSPVREAGKHRSTVPVDRGPRIRETKGAVARRSSQRSVSGMAA